MRRGFGTLVVVAALGFVWIALSSPAFKFTCLSEEGFRWVPLADTLSEADAVFVGTPGPENRAGDPPIEVSAVYAGQVRSTTDVHFVSGCARADEIYVAIDEPEVWNWKGDRVRTVHVYDSTPENLGLVEDIFGNSSPPAGGIADRMVTIPPNTLLLAGAGIVGLIGSLATRPRTDSQTNNQ